MGPTLISFLFTAGASTWLFTKFQKYNGNNTRQSAIATGVAALIIFFVFWSILTLIL